MDRVIHSLAPAFLLAVVATASAQSAPADGLPLTVQVPQMVNLPGEAPRLTLHADDKVDGVKPDPDREGPPLLQRSIGSLQARCRASESPGAPIRASTSTACKSSGKTAAGAAKVAVEVVMDVMRPLDVKLAREQVDIEERTLYFTMNNPAGRAQLTVYNASSRAIHEGTTDLRGRPAGNRLVVTWPELPDPVQRMELRIYDASDSWSDFELVPFTVEIPHEDVVFETAKWDVRASEQPKLDAAYDAILDAIREHGSDIKARLYVLGHTDTVGTAADN